MATIYFSSGVSQFTGGVESMTVDAPRVHELLKAVVERFPALAEPLTLMQTVTGLVQVVGYLDAHRARI